MPKKRPANDNDPNKIPLRFDGIWCPACGERVPSAGNEAHCLRSAQGHRLQHLRGQDGRLQIDEVVSTHTEIHCHSSDMELTINCNHSREVLSAVNRRIGN